MRAKRTRRLVANMAATLAVRSGLTSLVQRLDRRAGHRLLILEYHDVSADGSEYEGAVSAQRFRRHLRYLKARYRMLSLSEGAQLLRVSGQFAGDCVVITFDDGYAGNFDRGWTILREEAVPASVFLTTGFLDTGQIWFDFARRSLDAIRESGGQFPAAVKEMAEGCRGHATGTEQLVERMKYAPPEQREAALRALRSLDLPLAPPARPLTWDQVRQMQQAGCEIGCHTASHPILSTLSAHQQELEILSSRDRVYHETGALPTTFAFPNGSRRDFNGDTLAILTKAGFVAACTTIRGSNRSGCNPLTLRRIGVGSDSTSLLAARLSGLFETKLGHRLSQLAR